MSMLVGEAGSRQARPVPDTPDNVLQQFSLKGKVAVVNGASDGIGYAVAEAMAEAGADVALWYNSNNAAIEKANGLEQKCAVKAKAYQVPVTDARKVHDTIQQVVSDFGRMDVFVANAGMAISKPLLEMSLEEYEKLRSVNSSSCISLASVSDLWLTMVVSRRSCILCEICRRDLQETRYWQPHHHLKYISTYCERTCRPANLQRHESCHLSLRKESGK
jgi:hypothetical protein